MIAEFNVSYVYKYFYIVLFKHQILLLYLPLLYWKKPKETLNQIKMLFITNGAKHDCFTKIGEKKNRNELDLWASLIWLFWVTGLREKKAQAHYFLPDGFIACSIAHHWRSIFPKQTYFNCKGVIDEFRGVFWMILSV